MAIENNILIVNLSMLETQLGYDEESTRNSRTNSFTRLFRRYSQTRRDGTNKENSQKNKSSKKLTSFRHNSVRYKQS